MSRSPPRGRLKANAVVLVRLIHSPSTGKDHHHHRLPAARGLQRPDPARLADLFRQRPHCQRLVGVGQLRRS